MLRASSTISLELAFSSELFLVFLSAGEIEIPVWRGERFFLLAGKKKSNPEDDTTYIIYLDANNLYGWAMSQPLPYRNFKWVEPKYYSGKEEGIGRIYEVDLEYPDELHHLHNDYPCAAEKKIKVTDEMLSDYCKDIKNKFKISSGNVYKLIPTLNDKEKYVLHEENLKLYLSGLKLKEVHRVLQFDEKPWL